MKLQELIALWWAEAGTYQALPLESRGADRDPHDRAPAALQAARRATSTSPAGPRSRSRSPRTSATARTRSPPRSTIETAGGRRRHLLAGLALRRPRPLRDRRQAQVRLQLDRRARADRRVRRADPDRPRRALRLVRARGRRRCPPQGTLSLHIRDQQVGEATIRTQPGEVRARRRRAGRRPLGRRAGHRRLPRRARRGRSSAATIKRVVIDVSGEAFVDLAQEARAAFAHQ